MPIRRAFTYIELAIVTVVLAILFMAVLPSQEGLDRQQAISFAERFDSDVGYAASLNVTRPDEPTVLVVDVDADRYWLAPLAEPESPIIHPKTKKDYVVTVGADGDFGFDRLKMTAIDFDGQSYVAFDPSGGTKLDKPAVLEYGAGDATYEVTISPVNADAKIVAIKPRNAQADAGTPNSNAQTPQNQSSNAK